MELDPKLNYAPDAVKSVHLIGVGGVAMGALAGALAEMGITVRGSDRPLYPPMSTFLAERGIPVAQGFDAKNLDPAPDLVIVGNVVRRDNPEALALAEMGLPYLSLPQAMAHFFIQDRVSIVIAGTHGKTTTTALVASSLEAAGLAPGFLVGGILARSGRNFARGTGDHFVIEGDEYDTAFFDKRPKFVHYRPRIGIFTSCEFDHADIYADFAAVRAAFGQLMTALPSGGLLIAWAGSPQVTELAAGAPCRVESYGREDRADWRLLSAEPAEGGGARLSVRTPAGEKIEFNTPLVGGHNALNATAGLAALCAAGLEPERAAAAQAQAEGVRRRQEVRGAARGVVVVDDFAHHPTAVRETLAAVAGFGLPGWRPGAGRLVAVFEPRTNTSKRGFFQKDYAEAFDTADLVILREPPGVEDVPAPERFSSQKLADDLVERGKQARAFADTDSLLAHLLAELKPGDLCLVMSNGGFDNLHQRLLEGLGSEA